MTFDLPERLIRLVGLTGSIATGKSAACDTLRRLGVTVIDADELARLVVEPGQPAQEEIRETFGDGVFAPDGSLDRDKLGAIVFPDANARARLEAIIHPRVAQAARERIRQALSASEWGFAVYDVPLLYELGMEGDFDLVAVVHAGPDTQKQRLMARNGLDETRADQRIASQLPVADKARRADVLLDNDGPPEALAEQVETLARSLVEHNRRYAQKTEIS